MNNDDNHKCVMCQYSTNYKCNFEKHLKSKKHIENDEKYWNEEDVEMVKKEKTPKQSEYKCDKCNYKTKDKSNYTKHVKSVHGEREYLYECLACVHKGNKKLAKCNKFYTFTHVSVHIKSKSHVMNVLKNFPNSTKKPDCLVVANRGIDTSKYGDYIKYIGKNERYNKIDCKKLLGMSTKRFLKQSLEKEKKSSKEDDYEFGDDNKEVKKEVVKDEEEDEEEDESEDEKERRKLMELGDVILDNMLKIRDHYPNLKSEFFKDVASFRKEYADSYTYSLEYMKECVGIFRKRISDMKDDVENHHMEFVFDEDGNEC